MLYDGDRTNYLGYINSSNPDAFGFLRWLTDELQDAEDADDRGGFPSARVRCCVCDGWRVERQRGSLDACCRAGTVRRPSPIRRISVSATIVWRRRVALI
jgi:hypothetical protein